MSTTWRTHPFRKGGTYRVKKSFSSLDDFGEGEVVRFEGSSYSHYDGMSGFTFIDKDGKSRRWDIRDEEPIDIWRELFEEVG